MPPFQGLILRFDFDLYQGLTPLATRLSPSGAMDRLVKQNSGFYELGVSR
jgi:hypothetical protein